MSLDRREFLHRFGAATAISLGVPLPTLWARTPVDVTEQPADRILVMIQLTGGNDGLNTVIPHGDDSYYRARPALAIPQNQVLKLNDRLGLHPSLSSFQPLWDAGKLAIIEGVGYPQPDRSHFRSMDIWHSGRPDDPAPRHGWLGRAMDVASRLKPSPQELAAIGFEVQPLACIGEQSLPIAVQRAEEFRLNASLPTSIVDSFSRPAQGELEFLRRSAGQAFRSASELESLVRGGSDSMYPENALGRKLRLMAQMIAADLPARVYHTAIDGFDTHAQQLGGHATLLREVGESVARFVEDLTERQRADRVLIVIFSEFGRRLAENGSLGTDHGAASVVLAVSPQGGGVYGRPPSLTDLDDGDPRFTTDFRQIYATCLDKWLGVPSREVLGQDFTPLDFARV